MAKDNTRLFKLLTMCLAPKLVGPEVVNVDIEKAQREKNGTWHPAIHAKTLST